MSQQGSSLLGRLADAHPSQTSPTLQRPSSSCHQRSHLGASNVACHIGNMLQSPTASKKGENVMPKTMAEAQNNAALQSLFINHERSCRSRGLRACSTHLSPGSQHPQMPGSWDSRGLEKHPPPLPPQLPRLTSLWSCHVPQKETCGWAAAACHCSTSLRCHQLPPRQRVTGPLRRSGWVRVPVPAAWKKSQGIGRGHGMNAHGYHY